MIEDNRLELYRSTPSFLHYIEEGFSLSTIKQIFNAEKHRYNWAIEHFARVYILALSKHEEGWENSRQLCKQETSSRMDLHIFREFSQPLESLDELM